MKKILITLIIVLFSLSLFSAEKTGVTPDYSNVKRSDVPAEYKWNITDIYKSKAEWDKDLKKMKAMSSELIKMKGTWTANADNFYNFFKLSSDIEKIAYKLYSFASLQGDMDMKNPEFKQMKGALMNFYVQFGAKLSFVNSDILKLGKEKIEKYIAQKKELENHRFSLNNILRSKPHVLPADQQRIVSFTGLFSGVPAKAAKILNDVDMPCPEITLPDGKKIVLNYANYSLYRGSKDPAVRSMVLKAFWKNHKKFENTLAALQDAAIKNHLFNTKIHNHKSCLDAKLFGNNIPVTVYTNMIKSVKENLAPLHKYLTLKKELLGLKTFRYDDIYASAVKKVEKKYSFKEARKIITDMVKPMGREYREAIKRAFAEKWIDIYPNLNKQTGAYSSGVYGVHPYIKMNYNGTYSSVSTLAHELGHSMHSYFSNKYQTFENSQYTTFLAEIASTFNEHTLLKYLLKNEKNDLFKLYLLDRYFEQCRGTIYRQCLFAEFELEMHKAVEKGMTLTADWLTKKYLELTRFYYGHDKGIVQVDEYIGNEWSSIPHFYYNFYVYTYTTGMISSMALNEMVMNKKSKKNRERYLTFLKAGGSKFPLDILRNAGVDMCSATPYNATFKRLNSLIKDMEKLVKKLKRKKLL